MSDQIIEPPKNIKTTYDKYPNLGKLLSGRFILTVVGAYCFYLVSNTVCELLLDKKDQITISDTISILSSILIVVSNIFTFYFVRKGMGSTETSNGNGTEE